jgi:hypothetical protein
MKHLQLFALLACAGPLLVSCESTDLSAHQRPAGNQEAKRVAAIDQENHPEADVDETKRNLWNSQRELLVRDGNPNLRYY